MTYDRQRAKQIIREIIAVAGGKLAGKVRLHKAFYIAHLYYWQEHQGALTDYPIVRMPFGPGIDDGPGLLAEMEEAGSLTISTTHTGPYPENIFSLPKKLRVDRKATHYPAIKKAVDHVRKHTAVELSEETHVFSRSWQEAANGAQLNIYLDLLTDQEYERVKDNSAAVTEALGGVFGK